MMSADEQMISWDEHEHVIFQLLRQDGVGQAVREKQRN